jgi:ATP-dependent DNA ligase
MRRHAELAQWMCSVHSRAGFVPDIGKAYIFAHPSRGVSTIAVKPRLRRKFIEPYLPSSADNPPFGSNWIHEIKHDG